MADGWWKVKFFKSSNFSEVLTQNLNKALIRRFKILRTSNFVMYSTPSLTCKDEYAAYFYIL